MDLSALAQSALFEGLGPAELQAVAARMHPRSFEAGEALCRVGEPSDRLWLITGGLVHVMAPKPGGATLVDRQRKGDAVGEVGTLLGEERSASVVASIPTTTLELDAAAYTELVLRFPVILINVIRTLRTRLARSRSRSVQSQRGEMIALLTGPSLAAGAELTAAARAATPRPVTSVDRRYSFAGAMTAADDLAASHATVLLHADLEQETVASMREEVDRVVVVACGGAETARLGTLRVGPSMPPGSVEAIIVGEEAAEAARAWPPESPMRVVRECPRGDEFALAGDDVAWLARHLTRTKLGLALGAGGAKGYAHIGVLQVLEEAGYVVDYIAGSSIGAIVGAYLALGMNAETIEATLREAFNPSAVEKIFSRPSLAGSSEGLDVMEAIFRRTTGGRTFDDTQIPLIVMTADLTDRVPAPLSDGTLADALLAATALAGMFPPRERDGHRLVDGLALVPVPTSSVLDAGADIAVSVNLTGAEVLSSWPGGHSPQPQPERRRRPGMLDTLLEVMDLSQLDTSVRHADLADVVITPRFGPCNWRDFDLADLFLAAGREAATEELTALGALALPTTNDISSNDISRNPQGGRNGTQHTIRI